MFWKRHTIQKEDADRSRAEEADADAGRSEARAGSGPGLAGNAPVATSPPRAGVASAAELKEGEALSTGLLSDATLAASTWIGSKEIAEISLTGVLQLEVHGPRLPRAGFLRAILLSVAFALCLPVARAEDGSIWDPREGFRYTNRKAMQVGDLITVVVTESASGSNRSSLSTSKEHKVNIEGGPGAGPLDFIPLFNLDSSAKNELDGSGQVSLSGQLSTTLTVQVRDIRPDGRLLIEGSRYIELNGEDEQVTLSGLARPEDIRSDNTILSTRLAEVKIHYTGKGAGKSAARAGILQRVLSWIF